MDSYWNGVLASYYWDLFAESQEVRDTLEKYLIFNGIDNLRFNLKSDFRTETDALCIWYLADHGFNMVGYTARDDLSQVLERLADHPNIILNGSNRYYTNWFRATTSLREYLEAENPCLGSCKSCGNCYRLRGEEITVLVHGAGSDTLLNTAENREFIRNWRPAGLGWFMDTDFEVYKGFFACVRHQIDKIGFIWRPSNIKDLIREIRKWGYE